MNRDSILSVYSDARTEYTKQLCVFLVPAYFQFYIDLLEKSKQAMVNEPKRALWQFQTYLNEIHDWNMEKVSSEINRIHTNCNCDYMEDLLTAVFIAHTKVLTAIRLSSNQKKVEINIPKVDHFLFKVLCETSKLLWSSSYLFRDGIPAIEKQQNYRTIEGILNEGILAAVRSLVPVKSILKDFVNQDASATTADADEDDSEDEEEKPKKEVSEMPEKVEEVVSAPAIAVPEPVVIAPVTTPVIAPVTTPVVESVAAPLVVPMLSELSSAVSSAVSSVASALSDASSATSAAPVIVIDEKPSVRFGQFDTVFDMDHPQNSDMLYDPKEDKHEDDDHDETAPVLSILEEEGTPLADEFAFETMEAPEPIGLDDYEEL